MSLISGSERTDESRNATKNSPGPPNCCAVARIQATISGMDRSFSILHAAAAIALAAGLVAALHYAGAGLTLSHYDARGHLVVARRIFDNLMPCWAQIGAVWLPLPHLLNAIPVQVDAWYRSGASAVAISIAAFVAMVVSIAWLVRRLTGSPAGALAAAGLVAINPNLLYLQSTPMTEPLLLGLLLAGTCLLVRAHDTGRRADWRRASLAFAGACLTRYEAWPATLAAAALSAAVQTAHGLPRGDVARRTGWVLGYPAWAVAAFVVHSKMTVGAWLTTDGFFVPDSVAAGSAARAAILVLWGVREVTGRVVMYAAALGAGFLLARALARLYGNAPRERRPGPESSRPAPGSADRAVNPAVIVLGLGAMAVLPWYGFYQGHPFRIRYMAPLVPIAAILAASGLVMAMRRRLRPAGVAALAIAAAIEQPPLSPEAPMVVEAQWDVPASSGRQAVSRFLAQHYDGEIIMASMGSLAHYMHELSRVGPGFAIADFLHEGTGAIWKAALVDPAPHAGWVLIEEQAEGGDILAARRRADASFLQGFVRVAEGGGIVLYRRK